MSSGFSEHFTFEELTDSDWHQEMVAQNRIDAKSYRIAGKRLSKLLESIRHILGGKPLKVNSGYRNELLKKPFGWILYPFAYLAKDWVYGNDVIKNYTMPKGVQDSWLKWCFCKWRVGVCKILSWIDPRKGNHCIESIEEDK